MSNKNQYFWTKLKEQGFLQKLCLRGLKNVEDNLEFF